MSGLWRFRGALLGLLVLAVIGAVAWQTGLWTPAPQGYGEEQALFRFEKEDLVGIRIVRPDLTLAFERSGEQWQIEGYDWRPSRTMMRRVAHQLHDLTSRARVAEHADDLERYGLGPGAIVVTLSLKRGAALGFAVGDPNPTSVSYYLRPLPGDLVYIVKKAAVDYYRMPLDDFREHRFASFDEADVTSLSAAVEGRELRVERVDAKRWRMTAPLVQDAARDEVRAMMGRISAMRALDFVADHPTDRTRYGLGPQRVKVTLQTGDTITIEVGALVADTDPPQRYVLRTEDDAVYAVRDGFLEAFGKPVEDYRNRVLLGRHAWELQRMSVRQGAAVVDLLKTADGWRWPGGAAVPGSTPERVAQRASEIRALDFYDTAPDDLGPLQATVTLGFEDAEVVLDLYRSWTEPPTEPEGRPVQRQLLQIEGDPVSYAVDGGLYEVIGDLQREFARKLSRDAEKGLDQGGP